VPRGTTYVAGLAGLAIVLFVVAALYAMGVISFFSSSPGASHHYKHAFVAGALGLLALIAANFARPRTA
jgi:hypothetical protein